MIEQFKPIFSLLKGEEVLNGGVKLWWDAWWVCPEHFFSGLDGFQGVKDAKVVISMYILRLFGFLKSGFLLKSQPSLVILLHYFHMWRGCPLQVVVVQVVLILDHAKIDLGWWLHQFIVFNFKRTITVDIFKLLILNIRLSWNACRVGVRLLKLPIISEIGVQIGVTQSIFWSYFLTNGFVRWLRNLSG